MIEIPILNSRFKKKNTKDFEELDLDKLEFEPIEYRSYSDEQLREEDIVEGEKNTAVIHIN